MIFRIATVLIFSMLISGSLALASEEQTETVEAGPEQPEANPEADLCDQEPSADHPPEKMQAGVHEFSCRTVRWVDSWFGDEEDFDESGVSGKLTIGMAWNEFENIDGRMRYRVRSDLPNLSSRWDAFLGRVDEEAFISDAETVEDRAFQQGITDRDDPEWLVGLGYRDRRNRSEGWDYSIGLRLRAPPRFYTKARYRKKWNLGDKADLRFQQTFFWRDGTGWGATSHFDSSRDIDGTNLLRWELLATNSEETDGWRWWAGNTWYHRQDGPHGVSLLSFARGESDRPISLQEYGFELTWRRRVAREWLFFNFGPTLTWPRFEPEQKREASLGFVVTMDFEFGDYRGR